jgi:hypothetical protein
MTAPKVKKALIAALLRGSGDHICQLALYDACSALPTGVLQQRDKLGELIAAIRGQTNSPELRQALEDISHMERLLVAANFLFDYLRGKNDEPLTSLASAVDKTCCFDYLPSGPELARAPYGKDLQILRDCLRGKNTLGALRCLLDLNKKIMAGRGSAAWVEEGSDGRLRVRVKAETAYLPTADKLQSKWGYDYFLSSYARIAAKERR